MMNINLNVSLDDVIWESDWNGYEVGFDDVAVVGLYRSKEDSDTYFYIDVESGEVLEHWTD